MGGGIGPRTVTCVNWGGPMAMVPCLHQGIVYIKRKPWVWTAQKCFPLVGVYTPPTCTGLQTTPTHRGQYRAENGNLRKMGWTYCHGTMFAPRQCLYQKKARGMESAEMYFTSRCRNPTCLCGPESYPSS